MRRLTIFVVLSASAHIGLLLPVPGVAPRIAGQVDTVLSVSFQRPVADAPIDSPPPAAREIPRRRDVARPNAAVTKPPGTTAIDRTTPEPRDTTVAYTEPKFDTRARVRSLLLTDLERHFHYPLLARRHGWEGTVWLAFVVAPDGELERVHVARSSGYDALDTSALDALHRVGRLREASIWLDGGALEMQLPVIYRLRE